MRELMARHRTLCEQAVDPLEIAAGLEDAGVGPGTAARCRHADVFALAEEMYARVPRRPPDSAAAEPAEPWGSRSGAALRTALAVALPCAALAAVRAVRPAGPVELLAELVAGGALAVGCAGQVPRGRRRPAGLGYGLGAAAVLLLPLVAGAGRPQAAMALAAAVAMGAAEWSARWFRHVGRVHLRGARTIPDFRGRLRPVLPVAVGLYLAALGVLTFTALAVLTVVLPRPGPQPGGLLHAVVQRADGVQWAAQAALGLLLVLATLLLHCGRAGAAAAGLAAGAAATALPVLLPAAGGPLFAGHGVVGAQLLGCGAAGAVLLPCAWVLLGRPGSHR
ncbi:hypothetical protein [Kitasatospora sp. NPDC057223]|uniref:hypothetical protein n=1 Tax=Kitasatospora sp. NPDC057223 TaxID=3346055 RepID=UPI003633EFCE